MNKDLAKEIIKYGKKLVQDGLTFNAGGNLSVRIPGREAFLITPSGMDYDLLDQEDLVLMDLEGEVLEGRRRPSSEFHLHQGLYKARPDIQAIIHTHSPYIGVASLFGHDMPALTYLQATAGVKDIPLAPYATYGTQDLADKAVRALGKVSRAVILANHGLVAGGRDLAQAYSITHNLEFNARLYVTGLSTGKDLTYLSQDDIDKMIEKSSSYGQEEGK